jgi:hypothetical protein
VAGARYLERLVVSAYTGAANLIKVPDVITTLAPGTIGAIDSRHQAIFNVFKHHSPIEVVSIAGNILCYQLPHSQPTGIYNSGMPVVHLLPQNSNNSVGPM